MKAGGNAAAAIDSFSDGAAFEDELDDLGDLDDVELPDVSAAPKLKDFLPFMKGGNSAASAAAAVSGSLPAATGNHYDMK